MCKKWKNKVHFLRHFYCVFKWFRYTLIKSKKLRNKVDVWKSYRYLFQTCANHILSHISRSRIFRGLDSMSLSCHRISLFARTIIIIKVTFIRMYKKAISLVLWFVEFNFIQNCKWHIIVKYKLSIFVHYVLNNIVLTHKISFFVTRIALPFYLSVQMKTCWKNVCFWMGYWHDLEGNVNHILSCK